jgi:hypothetical protein
MNKPPIVAVDFDGTLVSHAFPNLGVDIGAFSWIRAIQAAGARIILLTMRSGFLLQEAVDLVQKEGITLWAINENPEQSSWTKSPKVYANIYVDDAGLGIPLTSDPAVSPRPYVAWHVAGPLLVHHVCKLVKE